MTRFFTYCWKHSEMRRYPDGAAVRFAYGSQFRRRGIQPGDQVYVVSIHKGDVHLLSKILVGQVTSSVDDFRLAIGEEPEPAAEYLIAEAYTPARLVKLGRELTQALRFVRGQQQVGLVFGKGGDLDRQSLRSVRRLARESATLLDKLLPGLHFAHSLHEDDRKHGDEKDAGSTALILRQGELFADGAGLRIPKTYAHVRTPNEVRFLSGMVNGVWIVVNLHKPGVYHHNNKHIATALRTLAETIERTEISLADQDLELKFDQ